jgi:adenylate kinase
LAVGDRELSGKFVILMGPPGAGKGTQAARVAEGLGLIHLATGDLFREAMSKGTPLGKQAESFVKSGAYVPDEVTLGLVRERLARPDAADGAILDGFPRTLAQADGLDRLLAERSAKVDRVVYLDVPEAPLMRRLTGRWTCRNCQAVYHELFNPPRKPGVCDRCGGELYQRPDDTPEVVRRRLQVYNDQTAPLLERYEDAGLVVRVDGERSPSEVTAAVIRVLRG